MIAKSAVEPTVVRKTDGLGLDSKVHPQMLARLTGGSDALPKDEVVCDLGVILGSDAAGPSLLQRGFVLQAKDGFSDATYVKGNLRAGGKWQVVTLNGKFAHLETGAGGLLEDIGGTLGGPVSHVSVTRFPAQRFYTAALNAMRRATGQEMPLGIESRVGDELVARFSALGANPGQSNVTTDARSLRDIGFNVSETTMEDGDAHLRQYIEGNRGAQAMLFFPGGHSYTVALQSLRTTVDGIEQIISLDKHRNVVSNTAIDHRYFR